MKTILFFISISIIVLLIGCDQQGCNQWKNIAGELKDTDGDGWLDSANNQKIDLIIESIDLPLQTQFSEVSLVVDDNIIFDKAPATPVTIVPSSTVATSRYAGNWFIGQTQRFRARVKVFLSGETDNSEVAQLPFINKDTSYIQTLNINNKNITFHYRTQLSKFADPSPLDSTADFDRDSITDIEESRLARDDNRMGDPLKRDIIVLSGFTAPKWAITKRSIERITTVFLRRGFNFILADENSDINGLIAGQVVIANTTGTLVIPSENFGIARTDLPGIRPRHIPVIFNPFTHFVVAAEKIISTIGTFGEADFPGRDVVVMSHLSILGPDPFGLEYQAKDVMHELGHNFGLCHPGTSNAGCLTGAIPLVERSGDASCMGSPADDGGLFPPGPLGIPLPNPVAITNAFKRPLDYSPTQWINIDPSLSRNR
ncbi:MAG: hypothetical protein HOP31_15480 [Ignavibacteria bacterium]|nr:hypothetical protein [Ignavibacteria bacterium]